MKLNGRQRTPSPDKMQTDENVSPWRIRVTLEATQDENHQGSPGRKRLTSPTKTTKVPLKDENDAPVQTPARRRGRPRKSDVQARDATPVAGSPGHTPGPQGTVGQKRKRGRPRKSVPEADLPENTHTHDQTPVGEPEQSWSPINMAVDGDSDDGLPDNRHQVGESGQGKWDGSPQRVTFEPEYNTPDVGAIDRDYMGNDAYLNSTPSKMPSPTRQPEIDAPANTLHAGHTPPPRSLPTPTSSSQVGDEPQEQEGHAPGSENRLHHGSPHRTTDPTDDHREFDSIMESEGFSMVSLDTLPSAKQHALNSSTKLASTKLAKGPLKPFLEREPTGISGRVKRQSALSHTNHPDNLSPDKSTLHKNSYPALSTHSPGPNLPKEQATANGQSPTHEGLSPERLYPELPSHSPGPRPRSSQDQPTINRDSPFNKHASPGRLYPKLPSHSPGRRSSPLYRASDDRTLADNIPESRATPIVKRRPHLRLARILRVGIALEGTLREHHAAEFVIKSSRRRLETLFSDLHPEIQRDLRAGLVLAEELAKRISWMETEKRKQQELEATAASQNNAKKANEERIPQKEQARETIDESPNSEMKRRMAEWQHEREAVSREIETANSNHVIVIDSDNPQSEEGDHDNVDDYGHAANDYEDERHTRKEFGQPILEEEEPEHPEFDEPGVEREEYTQPEQAMSAEEDDYEDIWQQEARDQSHVSHRSSTNHHSQEHRQQPSSHSSGSRRSSPITTPRDEVGTSSPAIWPRNNDLVPDLGYSRVRQLREQKVDLSPLYRAEYTPRRYDYYYGKSSPQSAIKQSPLRQPPTEYGEQDHQSQENPKSSPASGGILQQQDLARFGSHDLRSDQNLREDEDHNASDDAASEERSVHEQLDVTPHPPRQTNTDIQSSSWFQRLTSFTPGWLRAPKAEPIEDKIPENVEEETPETEKVPRLTAFTPSWLRAPVLQSNEEEFQENSEPPSARVGRAARAARADLEDPLEDIAEAPEANSPVEQLRTRRRRTPLAVSGYFTDEHYAALRQLYRLARRHPEYFPYYERPGHSDIIGDWIWTSDAAYGVPVTEGQFAVVDRFAQDLADASLEHGGPGQIGWTEADLHRRLISIIIGEQIREDRKKDIQPEEIRRSESRETSVDIWRP